MDQSKSRTPIVILSSDDWGWKTSKYQLSVRFARQTQVLFVSSIGFRSPTLASKADIKRIVRKLLSFFQGLKKVQDNIQVLTPLVIPFVRLPLRDKINQFLFKLQIRHAFKRLGLVNPYVFVFSQNWQPYLNLIPCRCCVYYVVDNHASFKGIDQYSFARLDKKVAAQANHIICSAKQLYDKYSRQYNNVAYVPHGVDFAHFMTALDPETPLPEDIKAIPEPRLLFFGHISHDWVKAELLKTMANKHPEWSIILLGRYSMSPDEFAGHANIHWLGEKDFGELPGYCKASQVGLIPFVSSDLTRHCNPLKLPEYLSAGLPVVSTDIPEVYRFNEYVYITKDDKAFIKACETALDVVAGLSRQAVSNTVSHETWDNRVEQILDLIES